MVGQVEYGGLIFIFFLVVHEIHHVFDFPYFLLRIIVHLPYLGQNINYVDYSHRYALQIVKTDLYTVRNGKEILNFGKNLELFLSFFIGVIFNYFESWCFLDYL